jgi:hypothetical protein
MLTIGLPLYTDRPRVASHQDRLESDSKSPPAEWASDSMCAESVFTEKPISANRLDFRWVISIARAA